MLKVMCRCSFNYDLISFCHFLLQVAAITVYFLLVVAFYAFFAPFLGGQILEYVSMAVYTPVVCVHIQSELSCVLQLVHDTSGGVNARHRYNLLDIVISTSLILLTSDKIC